MAEAAVRDGVLCGPRLLPAAAPPPLEWIQLRARPRGSLANLVPEPLDLPRAVSRLPADDVLVAVQAVGLNFRDALNVLGLYPGDPGEPGSDCAGTVVHVGSRAAGASGLRVGDRVYGLAHGCMGTLVAGPAEMMTRLHPAISMQVGRQAWGDGLWE